MADAPLIRPDLVTDAVPNVTSGATDAINEAGTSILDVYDYIGTGATPAGGTLRARLTTAESALALPPVAFARAIPPRLELPSIYPLSVSLADPGGPCSLVGSVGLSAEAQFDLIVGKLPNEYFVNVDTGSDTLNNGLTRGAPFQSMHQAVTVMNAAAAGGAVITVQGGDGHLTGVYPRQNSLSNSGTGVTPLYPVKWLADGGRVVTGPFDVGTTFTAYDAANSPGVYQLAARPHVERVVDTSRFDRYGKHAELLYVPTLALCRLRPGSWTDDGANATLYVNRLDGALPTVAKGTGNTRYYLLGTQMSPQYASNVQPVSQGWFVRNGGDWRFEGGTGLAVTSTNPLQSARSAFVIDRASIWFMGGRLSGSVNSFATVGLHGLTMLSNSEVQGSTSDGFNVHNVGGFAFSPFALSVNNRYVDVGGRSYGAVQGFTIHENSRGATVGDTFLDTHGYAIGAIDATRIYVCGATILSDGGDLNGPNNVLQGGGIFLNGTAELYADRVRCALPGQAHAIRSISSTTKVYEKERYACVARVVGPGSYQTVETWPA